jgi:hypothetical protein
VCIAPVLIVMSSPDLPPWPRSRSLVFDLRHAPELAVLAILHAALRAALIAEHPTLVDLGPPDEPPTLRHARSLVRAGLVLGALSGRVGTFYEASPYAAASGLFLHKANT